MSFFLVKSLVVLLVVLKPTSKSTDAGAMPKELKDLCHRLNYLNIIYKIKDTASALSEEVAESNMHQWWKLICLCIIFIWKINHRNYKRSAIRWKIGWKKLHDVQECLNQLKDLAQYYQSGKEFIYGDGKQQSSLPAYDNCVIGCTQHWCI